MCWVANVSRAGSAMLRGSDHGEMSIWFDMRRGGSGVFGAAHMERKCVTWCEGVLQSRKLSGAWVSGCAVAWGGVYGRCLAARFGARREARWRASTCWSMAIGASSEADVDFGIPPRLRPSTFDLRPSSLTRSLEVGTRRRCLQARGFGVDVASRGGSVPARGFGFAPLGVRGRAPVRVRVQ